MGSLRTLQTHAPWVPILNILECPVRTHALPARATCPLCRGTRLTVYEDTISGGAWHYCFDCKSAGDMIELAARAWGCGPDAAVQRLVAEGVPLPEDKITSAQVSYYVRHRPESQKRLRDFRDYTRDYLAKVRSNYLGSLRAVLRLTSQLTGERWTAGPGRLFGACHRKKVEQTFNPGHSGLNKTFRGEGWTEVLAFPFEDVPDRICGFLFVGRHGGKGDSVFRTPEALNYSHMKASDRPEAGLFGLSTVEDSKAIFGNFVVGVDDPCLVLRLQLRHFRTAAASLPLVAFHDSPRGLTRWGWRCLTGKMPLLWGWQLTPGLLAQAIRSEGMIALTPLATVDVKSVDHYLRDEEPRDLFRRIIKRALPWQDALKVWCETAAPGAVADLVANLVPYELDSSGLAKIHGKLADALAAPSTPRTVKMGRFTLIEANDQWWSHSQANKQLVMNAVLRIDRVAVRDSDPKHPSVPHYIGRIVYRGQEIPFELPVSTMQHYPEKILQDRLARAGVKQPLFVAPGWQRGVRLSKVALLFHTPDAT